MQLQGQVGAIIKNADGSLQNFRLGNQDDLIVSELHGKCYEQNLRGNVFTFGISSTALAATNAVATGVTASATPVIGLWNPLNSPVTLSVLKAIIVTTAVANSAVAPGGFVWLGSTQQGAITAGSTPFNCKTLAQAGSQAKAFAISTALTGLVGSLVVIRPSNIGSINAAGQSTAIPDPTGPTEEIVDGSFLVPPGAVLAIMNQISTTTVSVNAGIVWEEIQN